MAAVSDGPRLWTCFWTCIFLTLCEGNFAMDLFISDAEVQRLLGVEGEIYYIRDSVINEYALQFNILVGPDVTELYFTWRSNKQIFYAMELTSADPVLLKHPTTNATLTGQVPTISSVFRVGLECSGCTRSAEVGFAVKFNLTLYGAKNISSITLARKKICQGSGNHSQEECLGLPTVEGTTRSGVNVSTNDDGSPGLVSTGVFYIAVGAVCGFIVLMSILVAVIHIRTRKASNRRRVNGASGLAANYNSVPQNWNQELPTSNGYYTDGSHHHHTLSVSSYPTLLPPTTQMKEAELSTKISEIAVERNKITLGDTLQEGTFGRVYRGVIMCEDESESSREQDVFVKTVNDHASREQKQLMMKESFQLQGVQHKNVLSIMCVCVDDQTEPMALFSFMRQGNLKQFLKSGRTSDSPQSLSTRDLVHMGVQITRGMNHLGKHSIVHRDLATRNCVVDDDYNLKITDNALARDLFPADYHCLGDNENRPVKWMALEGLTHKNFSPASDVWSFGVTLWELVTLGQTPYPEVDPFEMASYLRKGYRMAQPHNCPDELFSVMASCWALSPDDRPRFTHLGQILQEFHKALGLYI